MLSINTHVTKGIISTMQSLIKYNNPKIENHKKKKEKKRKEKKIK
jgi:hypothetical protein